MRKELLIRTFIGKHSTWESKTIRVDIYYFDDKYGLSFSSNEYDERGLPYNNSNEDDKFDYYEYIRKYNRRIGSFLEEDGKKFIDEVKKISGSNRRLKDWYWIIPKSYENCKGMSEEEVLSYIRDNKPEWCYKEDSFSLKEDGYGIITGKGKVSFRRKEGNKKANTFDFVSVEFPTVRYTMSRKEIFDIVKKNSKNIIKDSYKLIEDTKFWKKNELTVNMLKPYNMILTRDYMVHIDFELKTLDD